MSLVDHLERREALCSKDFVPVRTRVEQLTYDPKSEDPKKIIMDAVGDSLEHIGELYGSRVLVATAPTPVRLAPKLILTTSMRDKETEEGRWQGKVGLILKLGVTAFKYDPRYPSYEWEGTKPKVGDWVYYKPSSAWEASIRSGPESSTPVRYIWDADIIGVVDDVEALY